MPSSIANAELNGPNNFGFTLNYPEPSGPTSDVLEDGFGFGMHYQYRPEESPLGLRLDMVYDNFGLTEEVLSRINRADSGYASIWGFNLSLVLQPAKPDKIRPFVQVGPGFYYEYIQASRFSGNGGYVCDPWFGCYPVSTSDTLVDESTWRLGAMAGAGINVEFDSGGALVMQAQFHRINNANVDTEFIPISLGYQWSF